ncbi:AAA family ATPase [Thermaerobacter sp. PB12/4term]|uniref:AAA family ATPase n=1 Tax=Thermaerobacter sp. PB12/4term TaxID=2293838 RepID=UPI000E32B357|nr:AAA family ATPase [Thermaerobacter sp. PB12/4term]QIA27007.1 AAA family ATPase [Thermaerobacter sp. PB12/4term]
MKDRWLEIAVGVGAGVLAFFLLRLPLAQWLPLLVLAGVLLYVFRSGLLPATGRGPAARAVESTGVTFDDIGGQAAAKQELKEALEFLRRPKEAQRFGIRPIKGILLAGPPGTGKTLLAKAAATYTDSAFLATSGSAFVEVYAGVGAQRVREVFAEVRRLARRQGKQSAILFIDEIEVLAGKRGRHTSHLEYDQTLNQLLVELDGIGSDDDVQVLVMAATNRVDLMDDALLRPGRFDRIVRVELPDREAREQVLRIHMRGKPLAADVDLGQVAQETFGFSGAHLESVCNEAAILAMRAGAPAITMEHLREAIEKVMMGERLDRRPGEEERRRIAVHECGHALVAELLRPGSVASVTIASRGQALGYVRQRPDEDRFLQTQDQMEDTICIALAGSQAERLLLGRPSTGAAADFQQAVELARRMVEDGMTPLGVVARDVLPPAALHRAVSRVLRRQELRARALLGEFSDGLRAAAEVLLERERLTSAEFRRLVGLPPLPGGAAGRTAEEAAGGGPGPRDGGPAGGGPGPEGPGGPQDGSSGRDEPGPRGRRGAPQDTAGD